MTSEGTGPWIPGPDRAGTRIRGFPDNTGIGTAGPGPATSSQTARPKAVRSPQVALRDESDRPPVPPPAARSATPPPAPTWGYSAASAPVATSVFEPWETLGDTPEPAPRRKLTAAQVNALALAVGLVLGFVVVEKVVAHHGHRSAPAAVPAPPAPLVPTVPASPSPQRVQPVVDGPVRALPATPCRPAGRRALRQHRAAARRRQPGDAARPPSICATARIPSEALRSARLQVVEYDGGGAGVLSTEAVLYRHGGDAAQAMSEIRSVAAALPEPAGGEPGWRADDHDAVPVAAGLVVAARRRRHPAGVRLHHHRLARRHRHPRRRLPPARPRAGRRLLPGARGRPAGGRRADDHRRDRPRLRAAHRRAAGLGGRGLRGGPGRQIHSFVTAARPARRRTLLVCRPHVAPPLRPPGCCSSAPSPVACSPSLRRRLPRPRRPARPDRRRTPPPGPAQVDTDSATAWTRTVRRQCRAARYRGRHQERDHQVVRRHQDLCRRCHSDIDKNGEATLSDLKAGDAVHFAVRPGTSTSRCCTPVTRRRTVRPSVAGPAARARADHHDGDQPCARRLDGAEQRTPELATCRRCRSLLSRPGPS